MNNELERLASCLEFELQECERLKVPQYREVWRVYREIGEAIANGVDALWAVGEVRWAAGLQSRLIDERRQTFRHLRAMQARHVEAERTRKNEAGNE